MRIKENIGKEEVDFESLNAGDCFRWNENLYVKSTWEQDAVDLDDGDVISEMCSVRVTPINAEVQIID